MKPICKRCMMWEENGENLYNNIMAYVGTLDEEIKVSAVQYEKRLEICDGCDALANGLCRFCGCFVIAKAAKKNQHCPYPQSPRW